MGLRIAQINAQRSSAAADLEIMMREGNRYFMFTRALLVQGKGERIYLIRLQGYSTRWNKSVDCGGGCGRKAPDF